MLSNIVVPVGSGLGGNGDLDLDLGNSNRVNYILWSQRVEREAAIVSSSSALVRTKRSRSAEPCIVRVTDGPSAPKKMAFESISAKSRVLGLVDMMSAIGSFLVAADRTIIVGLNRTTARNLTNSSYFWQLITLSPMVTNAQAMNSRLPQGTVVSYVDLTPFRNSFGASATTINHAAKALQSLITRKITTHHHKQKNAIRSVVVDLRPSHDSRGRRSHYGTTKHLAEVGRVAKVIEHIDKKVPLVIKMMGPPKPQLEALLDRFKYAPYVGYTFDCQVLHIISSHMETQGDLPVMSMLHVMPTIRKFKWHITYAWSETGAETTDLGSWFAFWFSVFPNLGEMEVIAVPENRYKTGSHYLGNTLVIPSHPNLTKVHIITPKHIYDDIKKEKDEVQVTYYGRDRFEERGSYVGGFKGDLFSDGFKFVPTPSTIPLLDLDKELDSFFPSGVKSWAFPRIEVS